MSAVKGILGHKYVALGATRVGSVTLLQDQNCILHVAVCKVNLEVGTTQRSTTMETLYQAPDLQHKFLEGDPVSPVISPMLYQGQEYIDYPSAFLVVRVQYIVGLVWK